MPTYQYRCKSCGESLEAVQSFADAALTDCPACGGPLRKVFSSVGVVFKGSGFYRTDNRDKPDSADSGKKASSGKSASAESTTSERTAAGSGSESAKSTTSSDKPATGGSSSTSSTSDTSSAA